MAPRRSPRLVLLTTGVILVALAVAPAAVSAGNNTDSASGRGTFFGTDFDFSARSTNVNTDARGRIRLTDTGSDPNRVFTAEVTCMRVVGATATTPAAVVLSGRITDQPAGSAALSLIVHATDSGKFSNAPDTISVFASSTPSPPDGACPPPATFLSPLADGEVVIKNSLP